MSKMAVMAEAALSGVQAAAGVQDFSAWMTAQQKRVYLLCLRLLRDDEDAGSAVQDTFFKAYRALERGDSDALRDPARWVTRIAVNTCLDSLRSRRWRFWRRRPAPEHEQAILALAPAGGASAEERVFARQIGVRLGAALGRLSDRQRSVFVLRHYQDRSLDEIARLLDMEPGTVKAHLARALAKDRKSVV